MSGKTLYLCEKPDQGRIIAEALGGGTKANGGISGDNWIVTWGFGHLYTPNMPQDYDPELKKWSWETLPIVPPKFIHKVKDDRAGKQVSSIRNFMSQSGNLVIATDPDREGELIAYEILNELKWSGPTSRLWLSDLTLPAVKKALANLRDAAETKPLYWAAMARTYADWLVGMNLSRAASLKLAAPGAKPMSVGRVQTPVLAMIVDLERKIVGFKSQKYFEITAAVEGEGFSIQMRHAPPPEKRILDRAAAEALASRIQGARGPLEVKVEARKQAPPALPNLSIVQQECNARFGWSADKALETLQALYEKHKVVTYPRTDCRYLPEEHKNGIDTIASNISAMDEFRHLSGYLQAPVVRSDVYNDKKITAHHAVAPTSARCNLDSLSPEERSLYLLIVSYWCAAHMPDMEYLQTSVSFDANGVPLRASGRQVTKTGWKEAFGKGSADDADKDNGGDEEEVSLPPLKNGAPSCAVKAVLDAKATKPPSRFTEKSLLIAMENIAAYVDDPAAKKRLKENSGIGTPATRAATIETLKARNYITITKRQITPTESAMVLIDAMRSTAPGYADPVMTAQWEDVLETISKGEDRELMKRFVSGIATAVRSDVEKLKVSDLKRMVGAPAAAGGPGKKPAAGSKGKAAGGGSPAWQVAVAEGTPIKVSFDDREKAKVLGAKWNADKKCWVVPKGADVAPFKQAGFL